MKILLYLIVIVYHHVIPVYGSDVPKESISVSDEIILLSDRTGDDSQATPHVVFGKDIYMVVWREGWHGIGGQARIFATRIDKSGKVLDPKGIEVAPCKEGFQEAPRIAFGGGIFLVVWQDFRNGKDFDILGARISLEGKIIDNEPIKIAVESRTQALPDIASDGNSFLVAWQGVEGESTKYSGYAAPVTAEGKIGTVVKTEASPQVRLAWNSKYYLAVYGSTDIMCIMLDKDGKPASKAQRVIGNTKASTFSVSSVGNKGWLIIGHRSPPDPWGWGGPGAMRCAIVTLDGKVDNPTLKEPSGNWKKLENWLDVNDGRKTWPWGQSASVWDGKQSIAVWQRHHICGEKKSSFTNCDLISARLDGWKSLDPDGIPISATSAEEREPVLASDGNGSLICVYEKSENRKRVIAARIISTK